MKKLEDFMAKNEPKRRKSKLEKLKIEVIKLYDKDYTVQQISKFLDENGIKTSIRNLYKFLKKNSKSSVALSDGNLKKENIVKESNSTTGVDTSKWLENTIKNAKG